MKIAVHALGGFELIADGRTSDELKSRPTCSAMLAYVATERKVTRDAVLALLWPEWSETRARHALSQTLYQIRHTLGRGLLIATGQELRIADDVQVDVAGFEDAVRERRYVEAAESYGGRFLEGWPLRVDVAFQHWVDRRAERLANQYRTACRQAIAARADAGDRERARALAERWAELEPEGAEAHRELIRLLVHQGQHQRALDGYARYRERLAESGLAPGPDVVEAVAAARARRSPLPPDVVSEGTVRPRIVVLPFAHIGPAEHTHLTDGLADETMVRLSRHPGLAVIARTSAFAYAGKARSLVEIGTELEVDYVLECSVQWRRAGSLTKITIGPQLVRVSDGRQLWAAQLESDSTEFAGVHVQLVDRVLSELDLPSLLPRPGGGSAGAQHPEAYTLYVRGLQYWRQRSASGLAAAIDLFMEAIERDRGFAQAYAGLALAYALMPSFLGETSVAWLPRARRAAERALELDRDAAEGHLAMGIIAWTGDLDAAAAGRYWSRTLELQPSSAQALLYRAYRSTALRHADEARRDVREALALDPLSVSTNFDAGMIRWHLRERPQALEQMRRVLHLDPSFMPAAFFVGADHMLRGEIDQARESWSRIAMLGPSWQTMLDKLDDPPSAASAVDRIVELSPRPVHWYMIALLYVLLGAPERAIFWIGAHLRSLTGGRIEYPTGGPSLFHAVCDPTFDPLRSRPEFADLMQALRLRPSAD